MASMATATPNPAKMEIRIRPEQPGDIAVIAEINRTAFLGHPHSSQNEHLIVNGLRRDGKLALSLVAETGGGVIGHIAFSGVDISDGSLGWFGLGPLAVRKPMRHRGVGSALVRKGLQLLRERGASGCVVLGDPGFYSRFGFAAVPEIMIEGESQEFFLALPFHGGQTSGVVTYHRIFFTSC